MRINYLAVTVATAVHWIMGGAWYGIFSRPFSGFIGEGKMKELETRSEAKAFTLAFLSSLVLVYLLARFLSYSETTTAVGGLKQTFLLWLGLLATTPLLTV